ncbi:MAG: ABC transporter ATP-binding protein [Phycisphaerales bacterium]
MCALVSAAPESGHATRPTTPWAVDVRHASKTYRRTIHALRDVSLQVARGDIFGLLGPNGAGKSTLVKILMTVIRPTRCEGELLGRPVGDRATLARVGYLPEHLRFPSYLTGAQAIDYFGALSKVSRSTRRARSAELLELVGMSTWASHAVASYSKGMRQRLGLAVALIADPELVVLDEPTDGVDPVGRKDIRDVLLALKARGKTVFVNSHLLGELEMVCDRVAIMSKGTVVRQGTIVELTQRSRRYEFVCGRLPVDTEFRADLARLGAIVSPDAASGESMLEVGSADPEAAQPVIDLLRGRGVSIIAVRPVRQSLEDLFIQTMRDSGDATPGATIGRAAPPAVPQKA